MCLSHTSTAGRDEKSARQIQKALRQTEAGTRQENPQSFTGQKKRPLLRGSRGRERGGAPRRPERPSTINRTHSSGHIKDKKNT
ncbi:hypothetical protein NPIL_605051 [Nephila pilipes]|uniref:Uncharacterized protein n=1 Tax=Nephila pilipes TaxID=299642 RepID=A0A8X6T481_NEPPI|nr:hypothetical protein NPIL_605051 [Nephila pilipes]